MATTFQELKDELASWINHPEAEPVLGTFVALAEADMRRRVRTMQMQKRASLALAAQYVTLPTDWLETIRLSIPGVARIELASEAALSDLRLVSNVAGTPQFYAHTGNALELYPTPGASVTGELVYFAALPALSDASPTNWLLATAPDAYLYGSLTHAVPYLEAAPQAGTWGALYEAAIASLNAARLQAEWSGSGLRLRNRGTG